MTPAPRAGGDAGPMIRAVGLGKKFRIYPTPWGRLAEWASLGRAKRHDDFHALSDVSFDVSRGESLGVIGVNGSGKSTLLKILSGALYPTRGTFDVHGRVLSLLELGTGLNPDLTGRQNVINSSRLLAFPDGYAQQRLPDIEAFADLADGFFDRPVRLYSSGMLVRLVFSTFACFEPDVFIIDEALSVGDVFFQQKCARRLQAMRAAGTTMLFVSHDLQAVEALCDRVMLLHAGKMRHLGDKATGIRMYYAISGAQDARAEMGRAPQSAGNAAAIVPDEATQAIDEGDTSIDWESLPWQPPDTRGGDLGDGRMRMTGVCFAREDGSPEPVVRQGQWLDVFCRLEALADVGPVNGGLSLYDRFDRLLWARGWVNADVEPVHLSAGQVVYERFRLRLDLEPGEYLLSFAGSHALRHSEAPGGWDQDVGGVRYVELKHAAKIAVLPRADRRKPYYGPSYLASEVTRRIVPSPVASSRLR